METSNQTQQPANSNPVQPVEPRSKTSPLIPLLITIIIILSATSIFFGIQTINLNKQIEAFKIGYQVASNSPSPIATTDPTADWKTYTDSKTNLSFKYPDNLTATDLENGVIRFIDENNNVKFSLTGINIYSESEYNSFTKTQSDSGGWKNLQEFTDSNNRNWQTDLELGQVYNYTAVLNSKENFYIINFQSGTDELTNPSNDGSSFRSFANQITSTFKFNN
jgi:hypothetical protein